MISSTRILCQQYLRDIEINNLYWKKFFQGAFALKKAKINSKTAKKPRDSKQEPKNNLGISSTVLYLILDTWEEVFYFLYLHKLLIFLCQMLVKMSTVFYPNSTVVKYIW